MSVSCETRFTGHRHVCLSLCETGIRIGAEVTALYLCILWYSKQGRLTGLVTSCVVTAF